MLGVYEVTRSYPFERTMNSWVVSFALDRHVISCRTSIALSVQIELAKFDRRIMSPYLRARRRVGTAPVVLVR
jgi:hypothetical protein